MHLCTFTCACKIWPLPSSIEFRVVWGMTRLCYFFFFFCIFLCNIFVCVFLFSLKLYFIKKKERKYKKEKKKNQSCFVGWKFLLIKGDGQLDRHTDEQISWLINTIYRCKKKKRSEIFSMLHCTHMVKKWLQLYFFIFYTEQFKHQNNRKKIRKQW